MLRMSVTFTFKVQGDGGDEGLEHHIDDVMDQLLEMKALDPTLGGSLASGEIEVSVDVQAEKHTLALSQAFAVIQSAIEEAGGRVTDSLGDPIESHAPKGSAPIWDRHAVGVAA